MNEHAQVTGTTRDAANAATTAAANAAPAGSPGEEAPADEFQLTVRKLEMPVRPRGVLAE
jgi:hypothetical protein